MKFNWKEPIDIPDGEHKGIITKITERTDPYHYVDIWIKVSLDNDKEIELKYGCPATLSQKSKLGKLLEKFGEKYEAGKESDPEEVLVGKNVRFMTLKIKDDKGVEYSEIVDNSLNLDLTQDASI